MVSKRSPIATETLADRNMPHVSQASLKSTLIRQIQQGLDQYFYLSMTLLVSAVVVYGFGRNIGQNLIHADIPYPQMLFVAVHAIVFSTWVLLFVTQSALTRSRNMALHRTLGAAGLVLGAVMPVLGVITAIVMQTLARKQGAPSAAFLSVSFNDMVSFTIAFWLAIYWRRRPEFHRRLMMIATCCLTVAAFARFPVSVVPKRSWYGFVDLLLMLGILRDLIVNRRIHVVYRYGLPCVLAGQALALYLFLVKPSVWLALTEVITR